MQKYRQNADFIHHDEPNNEITFSNDQYWTTHVTFLQSIPYANKTSFQLFQTFATILKEKNISAQLKKVYLKQMDHLINSRFNPIDPYSIIHFPDLLKMIEEDSFVRSDLDKFLLDSKEIKSSLENLNKIKLSGRHELYELDLTFYNYLMSLLMNMLMKPQEFLYKEGGYKPMNMKKNKNKKSEKPPQREKSPVFINLILKIKLDPAQLELIFNLKKINTTNLPPSKDETLLEICFNNFQYGISRITNNEHEFFYLWDLENLDKGLNSEIRRKDFLVRIMEEDTIEMSVVFRLKYKEKEGKLKQFLMKVTFESKNIYVDKNGDSIFFYFLTNEKFPLCYYQELCEQSYESPFSSKDFNRCNNFLVNTREMDQLMVSFLRANGCLLLEVTKEQTKNEDFKSFCEILHRKKIIKEYIPRESKRDFANQEFLKLKLEKHINMSHFLNLKKLDFKLKWLLLVLDSQDKIKLFPLSLHDFEVLCQFPASIIFQTLKKIALSNRDPKFTFENLIELMKTKNEEKKIPSDLCNTMLIRKILISPSCFFFCLEEELLSIRELQNKNENYNDFLIARFVDEDFTSVANNKILIWGIFEDFANNGLNLLDCKYDFVGFNVKMLEKESFLLVNRGERLSAERISETLLGKISIFNEKIVNNPKAPLHYRNLPYYCYRMNNCLGQGLKLEEVLFQNRDNGMIMSSEYKEKDNIILELAVDMQFYDGFISKDLLEEIAFALREEMISLIEVNFFGYSMLLVLNESLRTRRIRVKKEIYEKVFNEIYSCKEIIEKNEIEQPELIFIEDNGIFFDQYQNLKIEKILLLDFARKRPVPLNHSSLAILKALEEKNKLDVVNSDLSNLMIKYQSNLFLKMKSDLFSPFPETIASLSHKGDLRNKIKPADFTCYQQFNRLSFFEKCRLENISFPYDIFFRMLIDNYSYRLLKDIRDKASYCPFEHFNSFYAIPDPENQLVKQEAFLQISIDGKKEILIGDLLIFREFSIDPYEVRVLHAKEKNTLSSYVNVLIVSREFFLELDKYMKTPYIYSNRFLVLKDQRMKFEEVQKDQGFLNKIAAVYDLAMQRFNETDSDFCIRLPNVKNYFLDQISNKMAWDYKIQHLIFLKEQTSKLFKETKFGKFMVPYIKAIFSCYLCQFETNENTLNEVYPDFLKERVKKGKEKMIFERSLNLEGTLYGDALNESLKFDKQSAWEKGFVYDFSQAYYDEQFFHELDDKKSIEYIIEILDFYSEEIENIIENLGASNESEIYTGLLIEKSAFRKKNHIESFFVLSQINLITLYKKVLRLYKEKFFDFELKTELLGCYTYTICYYYAGCFLKDEEIRKFLEKYKRKRLFIGLPWLIFSDVFFELQKKLKAEK